MALEFAKEAFDAVASALALNFVPDPLHAAREMRRVTKPGGMVGAYAWAHAGAMRMMRVFWDGARGAGPSRGGVERGRSLSSLPANRGPGMLPGAGLADVEVSSPDCEWHLPTSTITGPRSSVARGQPLATRCRQARTIRRSSVI